MEVEMKKRKPFSLVLAAILMIALLCSTLFASFRLAGKITQDLRNSAYDSLMNSSDIIRQQLDSALRQDVELVTACGVLLQGLDNQDIAVQMSQFRAVNNLQHVYYADESGFGVSETGESFHISQLPAEETALAGVESVSIGYTGDTGQQHLLLQAPVVVEGEVAGAIYVEVVATRYYTEETFAFFEGRGRASLFNRTDGEFVIKAPQTELAYLRSSNIYESIQASNDDERIFALFSEKVAEGAKSVIHMEYGDTSSYLAILPCRINPDLYIATIISQQALQTEADSVSRLIGFMQAILIIGLGAVIGFGLWMLRRDWRESQAQKERELKALYEEKSRAELTAALVHAQEANVAKSQFLSNMSHDIRTPMNAIIGMTAIAGQSLDDPEKVGDCLRVIASSSQHLVGLISDILDMSRIESGNLILAQEPFALPTTIDSVTAIIAPLCRGKEQKFSLNMRHIRHEYLMGDKTRLSQVLINLLNNAHKFTPVGGEISLTIEELDPEAAETEATYCLSVRDNGIGIPLEKQAAIFDAFVRSSDPTVTRTEGSGLGLAIAKSIVQSMGGALTVESEPGRGSIFSTTLTFPIQAADSTAPDYHLLQGLKALVVDDEYAVCRNACDFLDEAGMTSDFATSGQQAIVKVLHAQGQKDGFSLILVDWKMPEMDGVETVGLLRQVVGPDIPIIILTSYDWKEIEETAREAGANAFLSKPLFRSSLHEKLADISESASLRKKLTADLQGRRVLIVEDNQINQTVARRLLESVGAVVETADHGEAGLAAFMAAEPGYYDAILMDIQMPIMDGYEATAEIRGLPRPDAATVPIIAMTANAFIEDTKRILAIGMNAHLTKPIEPQKLFSTLEKLITS